MPVIASATGCSECFSIAAARWIHSCFFTSARHSTSISCNLPNVSVPVLSKMKCVARARFSTASCVVTAIPLRIRATDAAVIAVGAARDNAQGQDTTSKEIVIDSHDPLPACHQYHATTAARSSSTPTNQLAIRFASWIMTGFSFCASSRRRPIRETVLSLPIRVISSQIGESILVLPPITPSPVCLITGMLSPVMMDSSTVETPLVITASAGIVSPGLTTIQSPVTRSVTGTHSSLV